ncbi:MAG: tRNA 2-thiouridine(34) synthase MnmA [Clostridia bacterium]|nr:tRNA 2-thiouridine(34) synthase MnmA [Clostridia bacterium]
MTKVLVGMSGGVDSAVTAYLLKREGFDVVGATLRTWEGTDGQESRCCEIDDARRSAEIIGIPYHVFNCTPEFERKVTKPFIDDYLRGLTPNPCVICNRLVKWEQMLYHASVLSADLVATGHYASVVKLENGRYTVKAALHSEKDQTYMLYRLTQEQLSKTLMPLWKYSKQEVREIAAQAGLSVAAKPDSQEICFITEGGYADYIEKNAGKEIPGPGNFVDTDGRIIGTHNGIIHYTVGQRKGLGISLGYPAYIKKICADKNEIVVGKGDELGCRAILCRDVNFMSVPSVGAGEALNCKIKVRYRHKGQSAVIESAGQDLVKATFDAPVASAAPRQSAVFYDGEERIIGGGIISDVIF